MASAPPGPLLSGPEGLRYVLWGKCEKQALWSQADASVSSSVPRGWRGPLAAAVRMMESRRQNALQLCCAFAGNDL